MENLKALNSKGKKEVQKLLDTQFGCSLPGKYEIFMNSRNRLYLICKDFSKIDARSLRINSLGIYFGEIYENALRLSIEGSQLIGKDAVKSVLELDDAQASGWLAGEDIEINTGLKGFVIIKNKRDFLGCGKISSNKLFNYVTKERRIAQ